MRRLFIELHKLHSWEKERHSLKKQQNKLQTFFFFNFSYKTMYPVAKKNVYLNTVVLQLTNVARPALNGFNLKH